jgi:ABC-type sugar transport system ATPase subunit
MTMGDRVAVLKDGVLQQVEKAEGEVVIGGRPERLD